MIDLSHDSGLLIRELANCTVTVTLSGVTVAEFAGIFDLVPETVGDWQSQRTTLKPSLSAESAELAALTAEHVFEIICPAHGIDGKQYKYDGRPRPDGAGLTLVHLAEKK